MVGQCGCVSARWRGRGRGLDEDPGGVAATSYGGGGAGGRLEARGMGLAQAVDHQGRQRGALGSFYSSPLLLLAGAGASRAGRVNRGADSNK